MSSLSAQSSKYDEISCRTLRRFERCGFTKRVTVNGIEGDGPTVSVHIRTYVSLHMSQVAYLFGTYPDFYSMKRLGVLLPPCLDGMLVHRRFTPRH